jgi:hypothetical protein
MEAGSHAPTMAPADPEPKRLVAPVSLHPSPTAPGPALDLEQVIEIRDGAIQSVGQALSLLRKLLVANQAGQELIVEADLRAAMWAAEHLQRSIAALRDLRATPRSGQALVSAESDHG